ncbi:hypothetical protein FOZ62_006088 [Perkinsus olseni]|uniref:Uncharacterized protein n=1 Tax=Perkinsus olseni TaxID=32597 RepID=A0A7J6UCN4_PEROL|nr:hypothetical protein FOZ62_006088 [Perkinsus olseni]
MEAASKVTRRDACILFGAEVNGRFHKNQCFAVVTSITCRFSLMNPEYITSIGVVAPLVFIIALLCTPPGMGGGTLFVPVLHIIGLLSARDAAATSQVLVASATLAKVGTSASSRA